MSGLLPPYQCTYCSSEVSDVCVKCAECSDIQLCLQCFSCGAEIGMHRSTHKYTLLHDFPLFKSPESNWKMSDELNLLSAIEKCGFGNWKEIAQNVRKDFSSEDVKQHYYDIYVHGNIGKVTWAVNEPRRITDHTFPKSDDVPTSASDIPLEYQQQLVYLPLRDDYEVEYDNDAEKLISDITFHASDDEVDRGLKLAQVRMYNERLRKRLFLKRIAREHNKIHDFFNSANSRSKHLSKRRHPSDCLSYEEFQEKMQIYARFYTKEELMHFYESLQREKELRRKALSLMRLRKLGCKTFEDAKKVGLRVHNHDKKKNKKCQEKGSSCLQDESAVKCSFPCDV